MMPPDGFQQLVKIGNHRADAKSGLQVCQPVATGVIPASRDMLLNEMMPSGERVYNVRHVCAVGAALLAYGVDKLRRLVSFTIG